MKNRLIFPVLACILLPGAAVAQTGSDFYAYPRTYKDFENFKRDRRELTFSRLPGVSADYRLGPGDQVALEVVNLPELCLKLEVTNSGMINMPLLGPVRAVDLTPTELEDAVAALLKQKQLVRDPEVLADVAEYVAKPIFILGEVDKAGEYIMSQQLTLMDAILIAGGLDITAGRYGYLHRRRLSSEETVIASAPLENPEVKPRFNTLHRSRWAAPPIPERPEVAGPDTEVIRVDLAPLKRGGLLEQDIPLRKGDVFIVPRVNPEVVYVIGEVRRPGAYEIRPEESALVTQAIAEAGGPAPTAKLGQGILVRHAGDGSRVQRKVDFADIMSGKQADFKVQPNDIIFIPGSKSKTLAYGLLGVVPQTAQMAVPPLPVRR